MSRQQLAGHARKWATSSGLLNSDLLNTLPQHSERWAAGSLHTAGISPYYRTDLTWVSINLQPVTCAAVGSLQLATALRPGVSSAAPDLRCITPR